MAEYEQQHHEHSQKCSERILFENAFDAIHKIWFTKMNSAETRGSRGSEFGVGDYCSKDDVAAYK